MQASCIGFRVDHVAHRGVQLRLQGQAPTITPDGRPRDQVSDLEIADGRVAIGWTLDGRGGQSWLRFAWIESGVRVVAAAPRREGFGTELLTGRVPYELGGKGSFDLKPGGIHCIVEFPLVDRESILDADLRGPGRERRS